MNKFINNPADYVDEMVEGIVAAHPGQVECLDGNTRRYAKKNRGARKVGIVTGGGTGHLPLFLGYVGDGMLDGCAVGGVFQSPGADDILAVTKAVDRGMGVLYLIGNYTGDLMNFGMAAELAELEGIQVRTLAGTDDAASAPPEEVHKRRGVAGIFFVYKAAGAMADSGASLDEVYRVADKANRNVRTVGVAVSPCIIPEVGRPSFEIGEGEMEFGMGIHGEPGIQRRPLRPADEVVGDMLAHILTDMGAAPGDEVSVLVNGLGATSLEELYIAFRSVAGILSRRGISIFSSYVGEFATSMEMSGFSLSLLKLDGELKQLLSREAHTPFFTQAPG